VGGIGASVIPVCLLGSRFCLTPPRRLTARFDLGILSMCSVGGSAMRQASSCSIPLPVYQRLRVLALLEHFAHGCYGKVRLQKVAYFAEKRCRRKVFTFRKAPWGPYSEDLEEVVEQLLSMGLVVAAPLSTGSGNKYELAPVTKGGFSYGKWLRALNPDDGSALEESVRDYGYLDQAKLIDAGHREKAFQTREYYEVVLEANGGEAIPGEMDLGECDDLMLSLSPDFVHRIDRLAATAEDFDYSKVRWR